MPEVYSIFEGGGVRGTALVGAVAAAEEMGVRFRAVAGASAGAIVGSLVAAGYSAAEMRTLLTEKSFLDFKDPTSRFTSLQWVKAWRRLGFYKGNAFHRWIGEKLSMKLTGHRYQSPSFEELPLPLTVVAADVVRQKILIFNRHRSPDLPVADAVRMSMSIPLFFCPVPYGNSLVVDGGMLSNFPAWVFEEETRESPLPVIGFRLQPDDIPQRNNLSPREYIQALITTVVRSGHELQNTHVPNLHLIDLPTLGISTTHFDITDTEKDNLYHSGYMQARAYLGTHQLEVTDAQEEM